MRKTIIHLSRKAWQFSVHSTTIRQLLEACFLIDIPPCTIHIRPNGSIQPNVRQHQIGLIGYKWSSPSVIRTRSCMLCNVHVVIWILLYYSGLITEQSHCWELSGWTVVNRITSPWEQHKYARVRYAWSWTTLPTEVHEWQIKITSHP